MRFPSLQSGFVQAAAAEGVATFTLARPQAKNALNQAMYADLVALLQFARQTPAVGAVVITGAGGSFTSGNDLRDFMHAQGLRADAPLPAFIAQVIDFPKPLLAAVDGVAYGIGTTLLMHCDYVVAHPATVFCLPFVKLGLVPEFGASQLLAKLVGLARAREWLLGGEPFDAGSALAAGLLHALADEPQAAAAQRAAALAKLPPEAVAATKGLLRRHAQGALQTVVDDEIQAFTQALAGEEFKRAAAAFFNKPKH